MPPGHRRTYREDDKVENQTVNPLAGRLLRPPELETLELQRPLHTVFVDKSMAPQPFAITLS